MLGCGGWRGSMHATHSHDCKRVHAPPTPARTHARLPARPPAHTHTRTLAARSPAHAARAHPRGSWRYRAVPALVHPGQALDPGSHPRERGRRRCSVGAGGRVGGFGGGGVAACASRCAEGVGVGYQACLPAHVSRPPAHPVQAWAEAAAEAGTGGGAGELAEAAKWEAGCRLVEALGDADSAAR